MQAVPIGDAQKRLEALEKGSVDVASAVADVTYAAFYGRLPGHSAPLQKIRGIALMNRAVVHLLIGPNVNPSNGLRGMRIVLGDPVGGNSPLGERLVNSTGVPTSAIRGEFAPYDVAADKLMKGDVDALIATVQPPHESIARALARRRAIAGDQRAGSRSSAGPLSALEANVASPRNVPGSGRPAAYRGSRSPARVSRRPRHATRV